MDEGRKSAPIMDHVHDRRTWRRGQVVILPTPAPAVTMDFTELAASRL